MKYLKLNVKFRVFLIMVGLVSVIYGLSDLSRDEARRKGLNASKKDEPISYYFTVGKKLILGCGLIFVGLSPLVGRKTLHNEPNQNV